MYGAGVTSGVTHTCQALTLSDATDNSSLAVEVYETLQHYQTRRHPQLHPMNLILLRNSNITASVGFSRSEQWNSPRNAARPQELPAGV